MAVRIVNIHMQRQVGKCPNARRGSQGVSVSSVSRVEVDVCCDLVHRAHVPLLSLRLDFYTFLTKIHLFFTECSFFLDIMYPFLVDCSTAERTGTQLVVRGIAAFSTQFENRRKKSSQ